MHSFRFSDGHDDLVIKLHSFFSSSTTIHFEMTVNDAPHKLVFDEYEHLEDNRMYYYHGARNKVEKVFCISNNITAVMSHRLIVNTNGGNSSELQDKIYNCPYVMLLPFTYAYGHNINATVMVQMNDRYKNMNELFSSLDFVYGTVNTGFAEFELTDNGTTMTYFPKTKKLQILTYNGRYTFDINYYSDSNYPTEYIIHNRFNDRIIPRFMESQTKSSSFLITNLEIIGICRRSWKNFQIDDSCFNPEHCDALILRDQQQPFETCISNFYSTIASKFDVYTTIYLKPNDLHKIIVGSNARDLMILDENTVFAQGNEGQDIYTIANNSAKKYILIQNYATAIVYDFIRISSNNSTNKLYYHRIAESLMLKFDNSTIMILDYFHSLHNQHLLFISNEQSFFPSIPSRRLVPFFYGNSDRNSYVIYSELFDYPEIILNATSPHKLKSYMHNIDDLLIRSYDGENSFTLLIVEYFVYEAKWNNVSWVWHDNGNMHDMEGFVDSSLQPITYENKVEQVYYDIFVDYVMNFDNISANTDTAIEHETNRIGVVKLMHRSPSFVHIFCDENNNLVFTDSRTPQHLQFLIKDWHLKEHRISILELSNFVEPVKIHGLNRFGPESIEQIRHLLKLAIDYSNELQKITPIVKTGVKCEVSLISIHRNSTTFGCLGFSSSIDQIRFVDKFCNDERMTTFGKYTTNNNIDSYVKLLENSLVLKGHSQADIDTCKKAFGLLFDVDIVKELPYWNDIRSTI